MSCPRTVGRSPTGSTVAGLLLGTTVGETAFASLPVAAIALAAVGALYVTVLSGLGTVVQLRAPVALRARILSRYMVALGTAAGAALFLVVVLAAGVTRPQLARTFDDPVGRAPVVDVAASLSTLDPRSSAL